MGTEQAAIILLGALAGGFVSGLAGFGTGLTALGIWLYALEPTTAATLVIICSVLAHVQSLPAIWREMEPKRVLPFIVPGLLGVPLGASLLSSLDARSLKLGVGLVLLVFSTHMLLQAAPRRIAWGGRIADGVIGFGGGILGGFAGLSGPLPTMWASLRGWSKGESRSAFQAFNLTVLAAALGAHAYGGLLDSKVAVATLLALPGTIAGAWLGTRAYARVDDRRFRQLILALLCASGLLLIWSNA